MGGNPAASSAPALHSPPVTSGDGQIELVLSEVRRLEEVAQRNDDELGSLSLDGRMQQMQLATAAAATPVTTTVAAASAGGHGDADSVLIKSEISQLRQRLAGTDQELHKTNLTLQ